MNIEYWRKNLHLQKIAEWISWISCSLVLIFNLYGFFRYNSIMFPIPVVIVFHIWSMLTRRYAFAFGLTIGELIITTLALFVALYPPIPYSGLDPLVDFKFAIWIWLFGGSILTIAIWVCYKAIKEITHSAHKNSHQPNISGRS